MGLFPPTVRWATYVATGSTVPPSELVLKLKEEFERGRIVAAVFATSSSLKNRLKRRPDDDEPSDDSSSTKSRFFRTLGLGIGASGGGRRPKRAKSVGMITGDLVPFLSGNETETSFVLLRDPGK